MCVCVDWMVQAATLTARPSPRRPCCQTGDCYAYFVPILWQCIGMHTAQTTGTRGLHQRCWVCGPSNRNCWSFQCRMALAARPQTHTPMTCARTAEQSRYLHVHQNHCMFRLNWECLQTLVCATMRCTRTVCQHMLMRCIYKSNVDARKGSACRTP